MSKKIPKTEIDPSLIEEAVKSVEHPHTSDEIAEKPTVETETDGNSDEKYRELYDRFVRLTADFENFRKRTQKEKSELVLYGNETLVREILPVVDNFERAVEHAQKTADVESIRTGVELILSQLKGALERFGVRSQNSKGEVFDPLVHEAVNHVPSADHEPNTVMEEHQKAYFLHQRLIRPALVTVAKAPETAPAKDPTDAEVSDVN